MCIRDSIVVVEQSIDASLETRGVFEVFVMSLATSQLRDPTSASDNNTHIDRLPVDQQHLSVRVLHGRADEMPVTASVFVQDWRDGTRKSLIVAGHSALDYHRPRYFDRGRLQGPHEALVAIAACLADARVA